MESPSSETRGLVRATALLLGFQLVEQFTGFLSQTLLAASFGASARTDAYLLAVTVVGLIQLWTTMPLRQVLIPMFRHDLAKRGEEPAWRDASVLLNNLLVVFALIAVIGWVAAPVLVRIVATGFDAATAALASSLTRVLMTTVLFAGLAAFLSQILLSYRRFVIVGVSGTVNNLVFIAALVLFGQRYGVQAAAVGLALAYAAEAVIQLPVLWRYRALYRRSVDFAHPGFHELSRLSLPLFVTAGSLQVQRVTERLFASFLAPGSLSALSFANLLVEAPRAALLQPLQKTMVPQLTELVARGRLDVLSRRLFQYLRILLFVTVPAAAGVIVISDLIVRLAYQRGAFDAAAVALTSSALRFYAIGVPATFLGKVLTTTYMSFKDTRTPMRVTVLQIATKIGLSCALIPSMAHAGIALADSLSNILRAVCLLWLLPAPMRAGQLAPITRCTARIAATAAAMGTFVYFLESAGVAPGDVTLRVVFLAACGGTAYFLMSGILRQTELQWIGRSVAAMWGR